jgi:hypothetical protein
MKLHNLILIVTIGSTLFVSYAGFSLIPYFYGPKVPINNTDLIYPSAAANFSSHVFAIPSNGNTPLSPVVFNVNANNDSSITHALTLKIIHTFPNGTQRVQFPNGTIVTGTPPSQAQIRADIAKHQPEIQALRRLINSSGGPCKDDPGVICSITGGFFHVPGTPLPPNFPP